MALGTGVFESSLAYRGIELPARAACFRWRARERHNFRVTHPECIEMGDMEPISTHIVLHLRVPSSRPSVSLRFRDLHGPVIALPCGQGVAQQFLNFLPLPQGQ